MKLNKRMCLMFVFAMILTLLPAFGAKARAANVVVINEENFPDPIVRNYVNRFDTSGNGVLEQAEIEAVTVITIGGEDLASVEGIEYFTNVERLTISGNMDICPLSSVDLSSLMALKSVAIGNTCITSLDVSGHTALQTLDVSQNYDLNSVDLTGCSALRTLAVNYTGLTTIDISPCPLLIDAYQNGARTETRPEWLGNGEMLDIYPYHYRYKSDNGRLDVDKSLTVEFTVTEPALSGWQKIDNVWYYYEDGSAVTGWKQISGKWYYFNTSGAMQTGWKQIGGKYYYFNTSGVMQTGWKQISSKWYYFSTSGVMATGWKQISGKWYYFGTSGAMQTGWKTISGKTYYFKSSGAMAAKEWCKGYWLNADGTWTYKYKASWKKDSKGWYYQDTSGWYAKNTTIKIDDKNYTFDAKGYMQ